LPIFIKI